MPVVKLLCFAGGQPLPPRLLPLGDQEGDAPLAAVLRPVALDAGVALAPDAVPEILCFQAALGERVWQLDPNLPVGAQRPRLVDGMHILLGAPAVPRPLPLPLADHPIPLQPRRSSAPPAPTGRVAVLTERRSSAEACNGTGRVVPACSRPLAASALARPLMAGRRAERLQLDGSDDAMPLSRWRSTRSRMLLRGMEQSTREGSEPEDDPQWGQVSSPTDRMVSPCSRRLGQFPGAQGAAKPTPPPAARVDHPTRSSAAAE
eukprot:TRINITY_DN44698_c0_g1_i1.p1 TRINITY_DN44698_c0_g1~~TRINITY_DN44698_c0_g1_i1.p1  ORF type:complete len:288 (+),score=63.32 TRINITY_DN44698_c0_g1_i1:82-864(+)